MEQQRPISPIDPAQLDSMKAVDVDLVDESFRQSAMNGTLAAWATRDPFYARRSGLPVAVCTRAKDVRTVYTDAARFSVVAPPYEGYRIFDLFGGLESVLQMEGERHDRIRRLMSPAFSPTAIQRLDQAIQRLIDRKMDRIEANGPSFDAMEDFGRDIIVQVLLDAAFRLQPSQQQVFAKMHNNIALATQFVPGKPLPADFIAAVCEVRRIIDEIVVERRANPGDDMISNLVQARDEGRGLNDEELFGQINTICSAALGTTAATIGGALLMLGRHPDQLALLRAEPALIDSAVEECLRCHGPGIATFTRFATDDVELGGLRVLKDMPVIACIQAASFDPEEFDDPLRFDIRRNPRGILAFGSGVHHCIGNRLARLVMKKALLGMVTRFPDLQLADADFQPVYTGFPGELSLVALPMRTA